MKTVFAIFLMLLYFNQVKSQELIISSLKATTNKSITLTDTAHFNKQPFSVSKLNNPLVIQGNNGIGFDIFLSQVDHMSVLIPDKSNSSSTQMPNGIGYQNMYKKDPQIILLLDSLHKSK